MSGNLPPARLCLTVGSDHAVCNFTWFTQLPNLNRSRSVPGGPNVRTLSVGESARFSPQCMLSSMIGRLYSRLLNFARFGQRFPHVNVVLSIVLNISFFAPAVNTVYYFMCTFVMLLLMHQPAFRLAGRGKIQKVSRMFLYAGGHAQRIGEIHSSIWYGVYQLACICSGL